MQRRVDELPIRQRFLIFCEGEKTEPNYFGKFRVPQLVVQVEGLGMVTISLVKKALELRDQYEEKYDQTWCVFDKDDFLDQDFNEAINLAKRNGMKVAYSNQSFELWYVLHFSFMHNALTRDGYKKILDEKLGYKYKKNSITTFDELLHLQKDAIRNARNLLSECHPSKPAKNDPSTTVHLLVEQLIKFSQPFGTR